MFLMHFIGDLHQPLHVEDAQRGGNNIPVHFDRRSANLNLHSIWDTDIPHKMRGLRHSEKANDERSAASQWADELFSAISGGNADAKAECSDVTDPEGCSMLWARETNKLICSYVLKKGVQWLETENLGQEYYDGAVPIVQAQIGKAGARLGAWINALAAAVAARAAVEKGSLEL